MKSISIFLIGSHRVAVYFVLLLKAFILIIILRSPEEEIIKNGSGVTCISSYCTCSVKNNNCICFQNMTKIIQK